MKIHEQVSSQLARPVVITLDTVDELEWAYTAFSNAVHMREVGEDSPQQRFYGRVHVTLNEYAAKNRRIV